MNLKKLFAIFFEEQCELCRGSLRKHGDQYYGGIDIKDGGKTRTAYVCNLCYHLNT